MSTLQAHNPSQFQGHLCGYSLHVSQMQNLPASTAQAYNNPPTQMQSPQASTSSSSSSSPKTVEGGKRSYDKWSDDEEKMLISWWAENIDRIKNSGSTMSQDEEAGSSEGGCVEKEKARTSRKNTKKRKMITRRERCFGPPFQDWKLSEMIQTLSWLILQGCKSNRSQQWIVCRVRWASS